MSSALKARAPARAHELLCVAALAATLSIPSTNTSAQTASSQAGSAGNAAPADIVVTPNRTAISPERVGSSVTVIRAEELQRASPRSVADVLRATPGVGVVETGGPGAVTTLRIRGGEARHTLVLIDGVRVNDPNTPASEFDFSLLAATDIERIEILRGPQSALYGSDAMGGVVNIITRKGGRGYRGFASVEVGSYGTKATSAGVSGSVGDFNYAISGTAFDTAGFSRYGDRIRRLQTRFPFENDGATKLAGNIRLGWRVTDWLEVEAGFQSYYNRAQFDAAFGNFPDTPSSSDSRLMNGWVRTVANTMGGSLKHSLTLSANRTERESRDISYGFGAAPVLNWSKSRFVGDRLAAEYQGDLKLGSYGLLIFGGRIENEKAISDSTAVAPTAGPRRRNFSEQQTTSSLFALWQGTIAERTHLSIGGRYDRVSDGDAFLTWRGTLAHEIREFGTKFRTSAGTGAKVASLFQRFSSFGDPNLESERSFGVDAGVDQKLFDDRLTLSATVFLNRYRDLIDFNFGAGCPITRPNGCFVNIARAQTSGFELTGDAILIPGWLRARASYTNLDAKDRKTNLKLARRPEHEGKFGFIVTPLPKLRIEPTVTFVGPRFSSTGQVSKLKAYGRFDVVAEYEATEMFTVFARAENLTDARYQEVATYGVAGRSFYGGLRARW